MTIIGNRLLLNNVLFYDIRQTVYNFALRKFITMQPEFNKYVLPHLRKFTKLTIDYSFLKKIDDCVLTLLNVSDFGKLNDKYDGQHFYQKFKNQTLAEVALEKISKMSFIDWDKKKNDVSYQPKLIKNGVNYGIISSPFGELPLFSFDTEDSVIVCFISDKKTVWISGIINSNDNKNVFIEPSFFLKESNFKGYLTNYDNMEPLNTAF